VCDAAAEIRHKAAWWKL